MINYFCLITHINIKYTIIYTIYNIYTYILHTTYTIYTIYIEI